MFSIGVHKIKQLSA